jgi:hypothetical protein
VFVPSLPSGETRATALYWRNAEPPPVVLDNLQLPGGAFVSVPPAPLDGVSHVRHAAAIGRSIGLIAEVAEQGGGYAWVPMVDQGGMQNPTGAPLPSSQFVPDIISDGKRFVTCAYDPDQGRFWLALFPPGDPTQLTEIDVPRVSVAPVTACRLALAGGKIGVAWQEPVPPSTARIYFSTVGDPP